MIARVARRQTDSAAAWTLSFFRPFRASVAALVALSLTEIGLRTLLPWPLKAVVDYVPQGARAPALLWGTVPAGHPRTLLAAIVAAGLLLQVAHQLVLLVHTQMQSRLAQRMVRNLRSQLFTHVQYLSLAQHTSGSVADSVYRIDTDASCLESLSLRGLFPLVFSAATLLVMFAILLRLDASLALASTLVVPFLYLSLRQSRAVIQPRAESAKELESAAVARLHESLSAIRLVKIFAREEHELERFDAAADAAMHERLAVSQQESRFSFLVAAITITGSSLVLGLGGLHILEGRLTVGSLLVVITYLGFVYGPLTAIATTIGSLHNSLASIRRVRDVLRLPRESQNGVDTLEPPARLAGDVTFENVSFAYGPERVVLRGISFVARAGQTIALVGPSGAGKTTVVSLLGRLYEPSGGRVLADGIDIHRFRLRSLREQIAVVPQESLLMSGTIRENIRYGRLDATDADVEQAARASGSDAFIDALPRGYDTPLGDLGGGLSGGQRQRLSIARAFLKNAPILILDEPTAALDAIAEAGVLAALARLRNGRTTFVIAHRLSTVQRADRILVMDAGSIVAEGRHDELLGGNALYRSLAAQLSMTA